MHILSNDDWICLKVLLLDTEEINPELKCNLYQSCLELNFELPETTFSLNDERIYIEADLPVGLTFKNFKLELDALNEGIETFSQEVAPKAGKIEKIAKKPSKKTTKKKKITKK